MIKIYSQRPLMVRAVEWTKDNREEVENFIGQGSLPQFLPSGDIVFSALSGDIIAAPEDWLVQHPDGSIQVMSADAFHAAFEEHVEPPTPRRS